MSAFGSAVFIIHVTLVFCIAVCVVCAIFCAWNVRTLLRLGRDK